MKPLNTVTFTGVDEFTSVDDLEVLSDEYPCAEWGLLYRHPNTSTRHRYPSWTFARQFAAHMMARRMRFALHVCGRAVDDLLNAHNDDGWSPGLMNLALHADRVLLNLRGGADRATAVLRLAQVLADREFPVRLVLPWNIHTRGLWAALDTACVPGVSIEALVDASGGRGKRPPEWTPGDQVPGAVLGYAGGLTPANLAKELPKLAVAAGHRPFWIEMETSLRDAQDRFDVGRCRAALMTVQHLPLG